MVIDRYDYIDSIIEYARGRAGINFQLCLKDILKTYYDYNKKCFEMPDFYGGDDKNDGWVIEDGIFYQVFAPTRLKKSLKKEIQSKFEEDLTGLLDKVTIEKKWGGEINGFIFIVNTIDNNLPHDSDRFFDKLVEKLKNKYSVEFTYRVVNLDYVRDLLVEVEDIDKLISLSSKLRTKNLIDPNAITEKMMIELITEISGRIHSKFMGGAGNSNYDRVSTPRKIYINGLEEKREEIEGILSNLDVVENAISTINQDILSEDKFERVKELIIEKYEKLATEYNGVELLKKIFKEVIKFTENKRNATIPTKFLIIYIFDKCDIFEKEEGESQ